MRQNYLVIKRRKHQKLMINDDIEICITNIDRQGNVNIGIKACKEKYVIKRKELWEKEKYLKVYGNGPSIND